MKRITSIIIFLILATFLKAQNLSIGSSIGFGHSWITNYNSVDVRFNPSWNAGLSFIYSIKKNFGLGADVKFSAEGNKFRFDGISIPESTGAKVTEWNNLNYVRVPLKLIYFFSKYGNVVRPKIFAGPSFGFFTGGRIIEEESGIKYKSDSKDYFKNFDCGITAGAGLNFRIARAAWLNTDIAYYNGFTNVSKYDSHDHNKNVQLNVGILAGIKRRNNK